MTNRTLFWGIILISFGICLIAWKLGMAVWASIPLIYLSAGLLISLGLFILFKKNIAKIIFLSLFSLILSFWILKLFDFNCCHKSNRCVEKVKIEFYQ